MLMKLTTKLFTGVVILTLCITARAEIYSFDPQHTYVSWRINHMGYSSQTGKWFATGNLDMDKAKVTAMIQVADLITGLPKLDEHLKSKDFFDAVQFPTATFVSDNQTTKHGKTASVQGILNLHGVSKPVTLTVRLNQSNINPITKKATLGFSATATIKRSDFGIIAYLPALGDEVQLTIEAEAVKVA